MKNRVFLRLQQHRTLLISLSAIVIFITTYLLILPAFTLEKDTAKEQGGITVSSEEPEGALSYEGKGFKVVASVDENAALPENTTLNVKEIEGDSEQYAGFYEEALKAVKEEGKVEVSALSFAKFYDMALGGGGTAGAGICPPPRAEKAVEILRSREKPTATRSSAVGGWAFSGKTHRKSATTAGRSGTLKNVGQKCKKSFTLYKTR